MIDRPNLKHLSTIAEYLVYVPYKVDLKELYRPETLYAGFSSGHADSAADTYDQRVYRHYLDTGKRAYSALESLARSLHDYAIQKNLDDFLKHYDPKKLVGVMGGHALERTNEVYAKIVSLSKRMTEKGFLMISGGGPGAMEATHLGAWMAGRSAIEVQDALSMLREFPTFRDKGWLESAFAVRDKYPQERYESLGVPTWLYGHEPATPFATRIAKFFDNSVREDGILTLAFGGIVYSPGSAGTMQEIFQDAVQNHYLSFGYSSPMIFLGKDYWTDEMPVYLLLQHLVEKGKYKNLRLSITDSVEEIVESLTEFYSEIKQHPLV